MDIAISYGTYYQYLKPKGKTHANLNIEAQVQKFNDGEIAVKFPDSIRGKHVFIFGDTVDNLTELLMTVDAARRSSASFITVVMPYYGFCRQDKKGKDRASLGASVIATILQAMGVGRIIAIDLHADQIQLAYQIPFEHLSGAHIFEDKLNSIVNTYKEKGVRVVLASPDAGGTDRVKKLAKMFNLTYVVCEKDRPEPGVVGHIRVLADPAMLEGVVILLIDDIVDTGNTLIKADKAFRDINVLDVITFITHPVLSNDAYENITKSGIKLIVSNTRNKVVGRTSPSFEVEDCSDNLMRAIIDISEGRSISQTLC